MSVFIDLIGHNSSILLYFQAFLWWSKIVEMQSMTVPNSLSNLNYLWNNQYHFLMSILMNFEYEAHTQ